MAAGNLVSVRSGLNQKDRNNEGPSMTREEKKQHGRQMAHHESLKDLLGHYDKKCVGKLKRSEVHQLLVDQIEGREVSEDELDFVFKVADANGDGFISSQEMSTLINCWGNYQHSLKDIEVHFKKHNRPRTGRLDREQLRKVLVDTSKWSEVEDEELDWLMKQARLMNKGLVTKPELRRVLALWDTKVQHRKKEYCVVQ